MMMMVVKNNVITICCNKEGGVAVSGCDCDGPKKRIRWYYLQEPGMMG